MPTCLLWNFIEYHGTPIARGIIYYQQIHMPDIQSQKESRLLELEASVTISSKTMKNAMYADIRVLALSNCSQNDAVRKDHYLCVALSVKFRKHPICKLYVLVLVNVLDPVGLRPGPSSFNADDLGRDRAYRTFKLQRCFLCTKSLTVKVVNIPTGLILSSVQNAPACILHPHDDELHLLKDVNFI